MAKSRGNNKCFPCSRRAGRDVFPYPQGDEQMIRYYGHYTNFSRGKRRKEGNYETIPCILEPEGDEKIFCFAPTVPYGRW